MKYILIEARKHDATEDRTCQASREMSYTASVFSCYLESSRLFRKLQLQYGGREKSIEEAARTVGLDLPTKK